MLLFIDYLLELTSEHQVSCLLDPVMDGVVINLQKNRSNLLLFATLKANLVYEILNNFA